MYEVLGRRVRPLALFLSLITLVRIGSFWFDPGLREVTTVLPTHVALVVALAAVVLIWLGYWCRQDDWVMVGPVPHGGGDGDLRFVDLDPGRGV